MSLQGLISNGRKSGFKACRGPPLGQVIMISGQSCGMACWMYFIDSARRCQPPLQHCPPSQRQKEVLPSVFRLSFQGVSETKCSVIFHIEFHHHGCRSGLLCGQYPQVPLRQLSLLWLSAGSSGKMVLVLFESCSCVLCLCCWHEAIVNVLLKFS